jgi:hypothetical protein
MTLINSWNYLLIKFHQKEVQKKKENGNSDGHNLGAYDLNTKDKICWVQKYFPSSHLTNIIFNQSGFIYSCRTIQTYLYSNNHSVTIFIKNSKEFRTYDMGILFYHSIFLL